MVFKFVWEFIYFRGKYKRNKNKGKLKILMIQIRRISMSFCKEINVPPPYPPSSPLLNIMKALSTQIEQFQKYQVPHFSFGAQLIQGDPQRMCLQRRLHGIISVFFLTFRVDLFLYLRNKKAYQLKQRYNWASLRSPSLWVTLYDVYRIYFTGFRGCTLN